jgi:surface antigen
MRSRLRLALATALTSAALMTVPTLARAESDPIAVLLAQAQGGAARPGQQASNLPVSKLQIANNRTLNALSGWQCVPFARLFSGIELFGDAWTWWSGAVGKYARGSAPEAGSVLVFKAQGPMSHGHVAVVSQVLTERIIQVTHANWSAINGRRGQVEKDVTVVDVSPAGDWSQVKVWYDPQGDLGRTTYPTYGFIYKAAQSAAARMAGAVGGRASN